ncbi:MAG: DUF302 domain-containing protein [Marinosulfonomonas sp.]|nr:DUF302 domain-containing protein [Marinosulfonomonas sp.]
MPKHLIATLAAATIAAPLWAGEAITYPSGDDFEDTVFSVESAILDAGLVIDFTSHTGDMLERTKGVVGSDITLFEHADIFNFCSASLSRKVMEADPMNIVHCPYRIFVMQKGGSDDVTVGFKSMPDGAMKDVEAFLDKIVKDALGL